MNKSDAARKLGQVKSEAKAEAARKNGKLGGRPRKNGKPVNRGRNTNEFNAREHNDYPRVVPVTNCTCPLCGYLHNQILKQVGKEKS